MSVAGHIIMCCTVVLSNDVQTTNVTFNRLYMLNVSVFKSTRSNCPSDIAVRVHIMLSPLLTVKQIGYDVEGWDEVE